MPTYRKKAPLMNGHYYINPNGGPLWLCTGSALLAETNIVPGIALKVMLTEDMPHFFDSLTIATENEAQRRRIEQAEQAKRYVNSLKTGYRYFAEAHRW